MKKLVRESLNEYHNSIVKKLPEGTELLCVNPGRIQIISGDEAHSADMYKGDKFIIGDSPNPHYYFGTIKISGRFTRDPGLSGKDPEKLKGVPIRQKDIVYGVSKDNVDGHEDDFWATFTPISTGSNKLNYKVKNYDYEKNDYSVDES